MKKILGLILLIQLLLIPLSSFAYVDKVEPKGGVGTVNFTFPDVTVMKDAPIGTVLSKQTINTGLKKFHFSSVGTLGFVFDCQMESCPSGVDGISYKMSTDSETKMWPTISPNASGEEWHWTTGLTITIVLYKTGETAASGEIQPQKIGSYYVQGDDEATRTSLADIVLSGTVKVTSLGCTLTSSDSLTVDLGNVPSRAFSGIGSVAGAKDFNVNLECDAGTNVNVNMSGKQSADSTDSSVLALTGAGSTGVSGGVGVQVLYNGTPLVLNGDVVLGTSVAGGATTYTFSARYIQTLSKITAGSANTIATLNISYE